MLIEAGKQVWVDTSGTALEAVLGCPGLCVKVNGHEIGTVLGFEVNDLDSAKRALLTLCELGMPAAVITLGAAGALLATAQGRWLARSPSLSVVSSVGSGDAFLGGLVQARQRGGDWDAALRAAAAAGAANVLSAVAGQFSLEQFNNLREQIQIQTW
jgi:fructose-1-phosphate kinase PfkB-like protein